MTEEDLVDLILAAVRKETAPLLAKIALLEGRPIVAPDVVTLLADTVADHRTRLIAVEARAPIPGPQGPPGAAGATGAIGEQGPPGEKGLDGLRGDPGQAGKDGAAGLQGKDGRDGIDAKDGLSIKGDPGERGEMGPMGPSGLSVKGETGERGETGPAGRDGLGLSSGLIDRHGHLVLTLSDGQTKDLGPVVGQDGAPGLHGKDGRDGLDGTDGAPGLNGEHWDPVETKRLILDAVSQIPTPKDGIDGKDGRDGLGFDDLDVVCDEVTGVWLKFTRGDEVKTFRLPVPWWRGKWDPGEYLKGHIALKDGSNWIALKDTRTYPGHEGSDWRLNVKKGQDGRAGKDGRNGDER